MLGSLLAAEAANWFSLASAVTISSRSTLYEAGASTPTRTRSPLTSSTMDLLKIGLVSDRLSPFALRDQAEWVMKPALLAVPGVAHVILFGGAVRQIQIQDRKSTRLNSSHT